MKQVRINQYGAPEVLQLVETAIPQPKAGEVLIHVEAIGVNYSDILRRKNAYFMPTPLPFVLGTEAVGKIVSVGEGVTAPFQEGTSVLAILPMGGGYAEYVSATAQYCVPLPPHIKADVATAIFVQGSTAQLMVSEVAKDLQGKNVLINAAARVGSLLVQLCKMHGANVIVASSSEQKLALSASLGADITVNYTLPNWSEVVKNATNGKGADVVFEMVGGEVYNESLKALSQGGHLIVYGCASGMQGNIHPEHFVDTNITQSGFNLAFFIQHKTHLWQQALGAVIGMIAEGKLQIETSHTFSLEQVAEAHTQIEARKTVGKVVLVP
jgi:NADPH2:quinone reductase